MGDTFAGSPHRITSEKITDVTIMSLAIWLPALFVLGIVSIALCLAFTAGCDRI